MKMRNGSFVSDCRLGWLPQFDDRSRLYGIVDCVSQEPVNKEWVLNTHLNQGKTSSCVGHAIAYEILSTPIPGSPKIVTEKYTVEQIYWNAQRNDEFPGGEYPGAIPRMGGTSVLAGMKQAVKLGWFDGYTWAFNLDEVLLGISHNGPCVTGFRWYSGMMKTDGDGFIHPTGRLEGGHSTLLVGVNFDLRRCRGAQSWDPKWGLDGFYYISFDDLDRLIHEQGEMAFAMGRHKKPKPR
jgi:hypothetical protein